MRFWQKLFSQLHEYLGKEALDVTACLSAHAEVVTRPALKASPARTAAAVAGAAKGATSLSAAAASAAADGGDEQKLRILLSGGSSQQGLLGLKPFSLINDVSLLTILDSYRLFGESAAPPAGASSASGTGRSSSEGGPSSVPASPRK